MTAQEMRVVMSMSVVQAKQLWQKLTSDFYNLLKSDSKAVLENCFLQTPETCCQVSALHF